MYGASLRASPCREFSFHSTRNIPFSAHCRLSLFPVARNIELSLIDLLSLETWLYRYQWRDGVYIINVSRSERDAWIKWWEKMKGSNRSWFVIREIYWASFHRTIHNEVDHDFLNKNCMKWINTYNFSYLYLHLIKKYILIYTNYNIYLNQIIYIFMLVNIEFKYFKFINLIEF